MALRSEEERGEEEEKEKDEAEEKEETNQPPVSGLARALTDSGIQTRGKREASSGDSSQLVVNGHIDTVYKKQ